MDSSENALQSKVPSKITAGAIVAFVVAAFFYLYQYVIRTAPGTFLTDIQTELGISLGTASGMIGALMYTYGAGCLFTGPVLDRFGVKRALPFGALFIGVGSFMMSSGVYELVLIGRVVQGAGCSFAFVACAFIASKYLPLAVLGLAMGAAQSFGMSGGSLGGKPLGILASHLSWNFSKVSIALGVVGLVFAVFIFVIMPRQTKRDVSKVSFLTPLKSVLSNPQSWLWGIVAGGMFAPTTVSDMPLGMTFFEKIKNFGEFGATLVSLLPLGWVFGAPLTGWISDRIGSRKLVIVPCIIVLLCLSFVIHTINIDTASHILLMAIMFGCGFFSGAAMVAYAAIKEANKPEFSGTASGVINAINFTSGALLSTLTGYLISHFAAASPTGEIASPEFALATLPIPIALAITLPVALLAKETGRIAKKA